MVQQITLRPAQPEDRHRHPALSAPERRAASAIDLAYARSSVRPSDWPLGDVVETPPSPPEEIARALDGFFARSAGAYGILIATPERILCERYNAFGATDRATPSWSMTRRSPASSSAA
jgi:hypothetical protein